MRRKGIFSFALNIGLKSMEVKMGKVKAWLMDMEEDAMSMTQEEWCDKHGESLIEVYNEARQKFAEHVEVEDE
jgi:hypothetical protein|tara:strand:- start:1430 stop:1648 length:219 start_codon:yes stop_codon:yes gene_type:complete